MTVGHRIKAAREAANMTQAELGRVCGITKQAIYKYETGVVTNIPIDRLEAIGRSLGVSAASLMGWDTGEKEPPASNNESGWEQEAIRLLNALSEDDLRRELAYLRERAGGKDM